MVVSNTFSRLGPGQKGGADGTHDLRLFGYFNLNLNFILEGLFHALVFSYSPGEHNLLPEADRVSHNYDPVGHRLVYAGDDTVMQVTVFPAYTIRAEPPDMMAYGGTP